MDELCDYDYYTMQCKQCVDNNPLLLIFFLTSFIPFSLLVGSWVVARFVYVPYVKQLENEKDNYVEPTVPYEERYPISDTNGENKDINYKINFVFENTPDGNVFMRYSKENEGFIYWCDDKQIAYKYLETVARKFVNSFGCQSLYIDRKKEIELQNQKKTEKKALETEKNEEKQEDNDEDSVFAKLKPKVEVKTKVKNTEVDVAIRANKYKYMGKIKDFKFLETKKNKEKKDVSFSAWKNSFSSVLF